MSSHTSISLSLEQSGAIWSLVRAGLEYGQPDPCAGGRRGCRACLCSQSPDKLLAILMLRIIKALFMHS